MQAKTIPSHQLTLNEFPQEVLKQIFIYLDSKYHNVLISVCKNWLQLILEQYSDSVHGTMLRFSKVFIPPIRKSTEGLAKLEKNLKHSAVSFTRNNRSTWPFLLLIALLFPYSYVLNKIQPMTKHEKWTKFCAENQDPSLRQPGSICTDFELEMQPNELTGSQLAAFYRREGTLMATLSLNFSYVLYLGIALLLAYILYCEYQNQPLQHQVNNPFIDGLISNFFTTPSGKLILDILHNGSNQYPPLNNNLTVSQLKVELLNDKRDLCTLSETFDRKVKQSFFSTKHIEADDLCSNNHPFKSYFLNSVKSWNGSHQGDQLKTNEKEGIVRVSQGFKMT